MIEHLEVVVSSEMELVAEIEDAAKQEGISVLVHISAAKHMPNRALFHGTAWDDWSKVTYFGEGENEVKFDDVADPKKVLWIRFTE